MTRQSLHDHGDVEPLDPPELLPLGRRLDHLPRHGPQYRIAGPGEPQPWDRSRRGPTRKARPGRRRGLRYARGRLDPSPAFGAELACEGSHFDMVGARMERCASKPARSRSTLSAKPWKVIQRRTPTPMEAILRDGLPGAAAAGADEDAGVALDRGRGGTPKLSSRALGQRQPPGSRRKRVDVTRARGPSRSRIGYPTSCPGAW